MRAWQRSSAFRLANSPGVDGTVRWAGAGLNTRKILLDLTRTAAQHVSVEKWIGINVPVHLMAGMNHGTIITEPTDELVSLAKKALLVDSAEKFRSWLVTADAHGRGAAVAAQKGVWQQVVVRCVDQRGDPIRDYHIQLFDGDDPIPEFDDEHVDVCNRDHSYRCFHFDVDKLLSRTALTVKIMALSGSTWIDFQGFGWEKEVVPLPSPTANARWDAMFDLTHVLQRDRQLLQDIRSGAIPFDNQRLFAPFTTTLVEIRLDRDAYPLDLTRISKLFGWTTWDTSDSGNDRQT